MIRKVIASKPSLQTTSKQSVKQGQQREPATTTGMNASSKPLNSMYHVVNEQGLHGSHTAKQNRDS
eukprot:8762951-Lingulodinium_polyedra.AAC.1